MKIVLDGPVSNARGDFKAGTEVDWPACDAQPLVDCKAAHVVEPVKQKKPKQSRGRA